MKLFGEYLLEQKLVSEEDLLEAVLKQVDTLPTLPEVVHRLNLLPTSDILKAMGHQVKNNVDFKAACMALGLWTPEIESKVESHMQTVRTPLGHILYGAGKLTLQDLTKAFDEFISVYVKERKNSAAAAAAAAATPVAPKPAPTVPSAPEPPAPVETAAPPEPPAPAEIIAAPEAPAATESPSEKESSEPEFSPQFAALDKDSVSGYLTVFTEAKMSYLNALSEAGSINLDNLYLELHILKGAARFVGAPLSEQVCSMAESLIKQRISHQSSSPQSLSPTIKRTFQFLWEFRNLLQSSFSEESFWQDPEKKKSLQAHLQELKQLTESSTQGG